MKILVTGAAGFIGYHTSLYLCKLGYIVIGIDNLNNYYDLNLKKSRLSKLNKFSNFIFYKIDISHAELVSKIFQLESFDLVIHLAAQAGVQYSINNPKAYVDSNLYGFFNIINECVKNNVRRIIYASSSSVYGSNKKIPFSEKDKCSSPISFYAATKISNEIMAKSFSETHDIQTTGLRFFTVYGPYGRPDMSPFLFADSIIKEKTINIFNNGMLRRDFTYIDDAVKAIILVSNLVNTKKVIFKKAAVYNVGSGSPIQIMTFLNLFEKTLNKTAKKKFLPILKGDLTDTFADISLIQKDYNFSPKTNIKKGVSKFIMWYKKYYT